MKSTQSSVLSPQSPRPAPSSALRAPCLYVAAHYRELCDLTADIARLRAYTVYAFLLGVLFMVPGYYFSGLTGEVLRCIAALPFIIGTVTGSARLILSIQATRLRRDLDRALHPPSLAQSIRENS